MHNNSTSSLSAVVLAGGFGTRIRHITGSIPKPLAEVNGKPFLHWIFKNLKRNNVDLVYLLTHFGAELIEEYALTETDDSFKVECVKELSPSGTGGSVVDFLATQPCLSDPFLLLNGDSLLIDYDVITAQRNIKNGCDGAIFGVPMDDASRYGTLIYDEHMMLNSFNEKRPGSGVINSGVYLFTSKLFSSIKSQTRPLSLENDVIPSMISNGAQIHVMEEQSPFIDIGTEASLGEASAFIKDNTTKLNN